MPISFTFDDGRACQVTPGSRVLDEFGLKGTFYVCPGLARAERWSWRPAKVAYELAAWSEIEDAGRRGHEIGNHSWSHPNLRTATRGKSAKWLEDFAQREIVAPVREIQKRIPEQKAISWAWPCHGLAEPVLKWIGQYHVGARPFNPRGSFSGRFSEDEHVRQANAFADMLAKTKQWGMAIIHGLGGGEGRFSEEAFRRHLEYLVTTSRIEVKTVAEVLSETRA